MPKFGVRTIEISSDQSGRRLDNYLSGILKNVPKSFIYRIIRRGEVRVNGSRSRADTKLVAQDLIRIPPMTEVGSTDPVIGSAKRDLINRAVIFENDTMLVLNKPAGLAVHGGSGLRFGVIDIVRELRPEHPAIELVHRLDRDTSGCLVLAKDYPSLRSIQQQISTPESHKTYLALVNGNLSKSPVSVDLKLSTARLGGEKISVVASDGKRAVTEFTGLEDIEGMSLAQATIATGRTHQIRVHAAATGHPVAGDKKYGNKMLNATLRKRGLRRMFLHAKSITLRPSATLEPITIEAELPDDLSAFLATLRCST